MNCKYGKIVSCLICGEGVDAEMYEPDVKICEKCKEAVMKVRADMERELWAPDEPDC